MAGSSTTAERKKLFLQALESKAGNVTEACKAMAMPRSAYYHWMKRDKRFAEAANDVFEGLLDYAESKLMLNIRAGKEASIFFFLKCRAKDRGYVERSEITGAGGGPVKVFEVVDFAPETKRPSAGPVPTT